MGNEDLTEPPNLKKKKDSRDLKIEHLKYYQCIHEERQNNTKQNVILSERNIPAEIKVIYIEFIENGRKKKINPLVSGIGLHPTQAWLLGGRPSPLTLPVFELANPICHFINGQEMSNIWKYRLLDNFTWICTLPSCPLGDAANIPLFYLLIFILQLNKGQLAK